MRHAIEALGVLGAAGGPYEAEASALATRAAEDGGDAACAWEPAAKGGGDGVVKVEGGRITVVDLAVHEPAGSGGSSRRAVAAGDSSTASAKNETVTALLECLGTIQKQQGDGLSAGSMSSQDVAYRETKLTMLLQPLFSNGKDA